MSETVHCARENLQGKLQCWRLTAAGVEITDGDKAPVQVRYDDIASVRLENAFAPTLYRTHLRLKDGRRYRLSHRHFIRIGPVVEDRSKTYRAVVTGLLTQMDRRTPGFKVKTGSAYWYIMAGICLIWPMLWLYLLVTNLIVHKFHWPMFNVVQLLALTAMLAVFAPRYLKALPGKTGDLPVADALAATLPPERAV